MSRTSNLLGAIPLIVWYGWGLSREIPSVIRHYAAITAGGTVDALSALQVFTETVSLAYISLVVILLIVRDVPRAQARGLVPYTAAFIGTFAIASFFVLPAAPPSLPLLVLATLCVALGLGLSLSTLIYLGRSFAILPSARALVTDGPYRFVRHPLYLSEEVVVVGIMLQFAEPWALFVVAVHAGAQLVRMPYEEQTLARAFPAYADYAAHTARLIPGVY